MFWLRNVTSIVHQIYLYMHRTHVEPPETHRKSAYSYGKIKALGCCACANSDSLWKLVISFSKIICVLSFVMAGKSHFNLPATESGRQFFSSMAVCVCVGAVCVWFRKNILWEPCSLMHVQVWYVDLWPRCPLSDSLKHAHTSRERYSWWQYRQKASWGKLSYNSSNHSHTWCAAGKKIHRLLTWGMRLQSWVWLVMVMLNDFEL